MSDESTETGGSDLPTDPTDTSVPSHGYDALITIVTIVLSIVFLVLSETFADIRISQYDPGAAFWPRATFLVVILASLVNLYKIYRDAKSENRVSETFLPSFDIDIEMSDGDKRFIATIVIFGIYLLVIDSLGFIATTPFFLMAMAWMLGYRGRPVKLLAFAFLTSIVFFAVFTNFNIALPKGTGPFQDFSIYLENRLSVSI